MSALDSGDAAAGVVADAVGMTVSAVALSFVFADDMASVVVGTIAARLLSLDTDADAAR